MSKETLFSAIFSCTHSLWGWEDVPSMYECQRLCMNCSLTPGCTKSVLRTSKKQNIPEGACPQTRLLHTLLHLMNRTLLPTGLIRIEWRTVAEYHKWKNFGVPNILLKICWCWKVFIVMEGYKNTSTPTIHCEHGHVTYGLAKTIACVGRTPHNYHLG